MSGLEKKGQVRPTKVHHKMGLNFIKLVSHHFGFKIKNLKILYTVKICPNN